MSGHGRRFRRLVEERLATRFHVLAPDLRGHGRSSWEPPWDNLTHLDDVDDTVSDGARVERASWVGHSYGGRLVLQMATQRPAVVERAVLLDPAVQILPQRALELAEAERAEKAFGSVDEAIEKRIASAPLYRTPHELLGEEMEEHLVRSPDGLLRYRYCQSAVVTMYGDLAHEPVIQLPQVPTLLVIGVESGLVTEEQVELLGAHLGDLLEVVTVPGGHVVLWDAYEETADAVDAFLRRA